MDWTRAHPGEEGYYWYAGDYFRARYALPDLLLVRVKPVFDPPFAERRFMVSAPGAGDWTPVDEVEGLWRGPLDLKPPPRP